MMPHLVLYLIKACILNWVLIGSTNLVTIGIMPVYIWPLVILSFLGSNMINISAFKFCPLQSGVTLDSLSNTEHISSFFNLYAY